MRVNGEDTSVKINNGLISLPTDIPTNVTVLNLTQNNLTQLLDGDLDQFTDLNELNLSINKIFTAEMNH